MRNISVFFCFVQNPLNSAQNELNPAQNQLNELNSAQSDLLKCRFHGARNISSHIYKQLSSPENQLNPAQHNFLNKWFRGRPQGGGLESSMTDFSVAVFLLGACFFFLGCVAGPFLMPKNKDRRHLHKLNMVPVGVIKAFVNQTICI